MATPQTRNKICEAAVRTAARDGILAMTLDNVAKEAGVSKGGVMYHFATKDDLIRGMLEYFGSQCESMLLRKIADDPDPRFRWARSIVSCLFPERSPTELATASEPFPPDVIQQFMLTTLTVAVNSPGVFSPLREIGTRIRERLLRDPKEGLDQMLIWLAIDGLLLWQFIGMIDRDDPLFEQLGEALRQKVNLPAMAEVTT